MKKIARMILAASTICIMCLNTASVFAASKTVALSGNSQGATALCVTTYDTTAAVKPVYASQALHTKGYTTTIGVSSDVTTTSTASATVSATVGAEFAGISASTALSLGASASVSYRVGTSIVYTISAATANGRYRIDVVFPQNKVNFHFFQSTASGTKTIKNVTITSMPRTNDAYHKLTRYADA